MFNLLELLKCFAIPCAITTILIKNTKIHFYDIIYRL